MGLIYDISFWLMLAVLISILIFVVSLYIRGAFRWRPVLHIENAIAPTDEQFMLALQGLSKSLVTEGEVVDFWDTAKTIQQARLDAIASACHSIQFETFIMTPGKRTQDFAAALSRKAAEGITVQILVDSMGTRHMPGKYWQRLRAAGVKVVHFNPFDWRAPANFSGRTHRKLLIIDGYRVLIGGAGISDLWDGNEKSDDTQPWLDIELALTGDVVKILAASFQSHWQGHQRDDEVTGIDMGKIFPSSVQQSIEDNVKAQAQQNETYPVLVIAGEKPSYRDSSIESAKQTLLACARQRIWLSSPYFLPNKSSRQLLISAKQAGVDVKILTTSIRSDKKSVYFASYEVYGPLLEAGVQIFEYQPSMLHAKMLLIDDEWVNTGSANFDYRSFLHNDELDILVKAPHLVTTIESVFKAGFLQSEQIGLKQWQRRSWLKHRVLGNAVRLVQWQL